MCHPNMVVMCYMVANHITLLHIVQPLEQEWVNEIECQKLDCEYNSPVTLKRKKQPKDQMEPMVTSPCKDWSRPVHRP